MISKSNRKAFTAPIVKLKTLSQKATEDREKSAQKVQKNHFATKMNKQTIQKGLREFKLEVVYQ